MNDTLVPFFLCVVLPLGYFVVRIPSLRSSATVRVVGVIAVILAFALNAPTEGLGELVLERVKMTLAALLGLALLARQWGVLGRDGWLAALTAVTACSVAVYFNFFAFHGPYGFAHPSEIAHYYLGSKYFEEIRYGDLYRAILRAQSEAFPPVPTELWVRDLDTNRMVPARDELATTDSVKARFSPERWDEFRLDVAQCHRQLAQLWQDFLSDHGFVATPVWALVGGAIANRVPAGDGRAIAWLSLIDPALLVLGFFAIARTFAIETSLLAVSYYCLMFGASFAVIGGSFLRSLCLVAMILSATCVATRRHAIAGALLGLAAMLRVFPAFFAAGMVGKAADCLWRRRQWSPAATFLVAFGSTAALSFAASWWAGPTWQPWSAFSRNSEIHLASHPSNVVGASGVVFLISPLLGIDRDPEGLGKMMQLFTWFQQVQMFCLAPLAVAIVFAFARHLDDVSALAIGVLPVFSTVNLASYYYLFLVLLLIANRLHHGRLALMFGVEFATYYLELFESSATVIYLYRSALVFWLLVVLLFEQFRDLASRAGSEHDHQPLVGKPRVR